MWSKFYFIYHIFRFTFRHTVLRYIGKISGQKPVNISKFSSSSKEEAEDILAALSPEELAEGIRRRLHDQRAAVCHALSRAHRTPLTEATAVGHLRELRHHGVEAAEAGGNEAGQRSQVRTGVGAHRERRSRLHIVTQSLNKKKRIRIIYMKL